MANKQAAVIGVGGIGLHHGTWIKDTERIDLVAVCDTNEAHRQRVEEAHPGVPFFSSTDDLYANVSPDLVAVVVPHNLHAPIAIEALEKGANVVVEKPMATTYADCQRMIAAAKANDRFLSVFHNRRWDGWFLAAKTAIEEGMLGDLIELNIGILYGPGPDRWRGWQEPSGGLMYDWGAHFVDYLLNFVTEPITSVTGCAFKRPEKDAGLVDDFSSVRVRFESGIVANLTSYATGTQQPYRYYFTGTRGTLIDTWDHGPDGSLKVKTRLENGIVAETTVPYAKKGWQGYYNNIADSLIDGKPLAVSAESAAEVIHVLETADRSWSQGGVPLALID